MAVCVSTTEDFTVHESATSWTLDSAENLLIKSGSETVAIYCRGYWMFASTETTTK